MFRSAISRGRIILPTQRSYIINRPSTLTLQVYRAMSRPKLFKQADARWSYPVDARPRSGGGIAVAPSLAISCKPCQRFRRKSSSPPTCEQARYGSGCSCVTLVVRIRRGTRSLVRAGSSAEKRSRRGSVQGRMGACVSVADERTGRCPEGESFLVKATAKGWASGLTVRSLRLAGEESFWRKACPRRWESGGDVSWFCFCSGKGDNRQPPFSRALPETTDGG